MDFPSNSKVSAPSGEASPSDKKEKVVLKVVRGEAILQKQSLGSRLRNIFMGNDIKETIENGIKNVLIPTAKDLAFDLVVNSLRSATYGNSDTRRTIGVVGSRLVGNALQHTAYDRYSKPGRTTLREEVHRPTSMSRQARAQHNFEEIILPTRRDAMAVIEGMADIIDAHGSVTVSDMYLLVGEESTFADQKYGWTNVSDARPRPVRNGFLLDLPAPEPLTIR